MHFGGVSIAPCPAAYSSSHRFRCCKMVSFSLDLYWGRGRNLGIRMPPGIDVMGFCPDGTGLGFQGSRPLESEF